MLSSNKCLNKTNYIGNYKDNLNYIIILHLKTNSERMDSVKQDCKILIYTNTRLLSCVFRDITQIICKIIETEQGLGCIK